METSKCKAHFRSLGNHMRLMVLILSFQILTESAVMAELSCDHYLTKKKCENIKIAFEGKDCLIGPGPGIAEYDSREYCMGIQEGIVLSLRQLDEGFSQGCSWKGVKVKRSSQNEEAFSLPDDIALRRISYCIGVKSALTQSECIIEDLPPMLTESTRAHEYILKFNHQEVALKTLENINFPPYRMT